MKSTIRLIGLLAVALSTPMPAQAERYTGRSYSDPHSDFNRTTRDIERRSRERELDRKLDQIERNTRMPYSPSYPPADFLNQPAWTPKGER